MRDPGYRAALAELRQFSRSAPDRGAVSILVRTVSISKAAARVVVQNQLNTKAERQRAVIAAADAIRADAARAGK